MATQTKGFCRLVAVLVTFISFVAHADQPLHNGAFLDATATMNCGNSTDCAKLAKQYYEYIGVYDANGQPNPAALSRGSITKWRALHGFSSDPAHPVADEVRVSYYNRGDLQIGRDMHCRNYREPRELPAANKWVLACYVTNYSDNNNTHSFETSDPGTAIDNAIAAKFFAPNGLIATVVMEAVYGGVLAGSKEPEVWFAAYNQTGAPIPTATLDDSTNNNQQNVQAIPGICLSCHGGFGAQGVGTKVSAANGRVIVQNARFLPFDPTQFLYHSGSNGTTKVPSATEQEQFRKLNAMIRAVYAPYPVHPIRDLIDGWYAGCGGVNKPNCAVNEAFVPSAPCPSTPDAAGGPFHTCGWKTGAPKFPTIKPGFDMTAFYLNVPAKYCRTCHIASPERFNVQNFNTWFAYSGPANSSSGGLLDSDIRIGHTMPFSDAAYKAYWSDPSAQSYLANYLDNIPVLVPPSPGQICRNNCIGPDTSCKNAAHNGPERGAC